jgi:hypothetical protein
MLKNILKVDNVGFKGGPIKTFWVVRSMVYGASRLTVLSWKIWNLILAAGGRH